ncbi:MAG TPA: hypothetical protein VJH22_04920 [Candidatus Nanoarchaeia archaeon]|nr:hypothetical protein [Candidatus Nanoarchaeia archaeon]
MSSESLQESIKRLYKASDALLQKGVAPAIERPSVIDFGGSARNQLRSNYVQAIDKLKQSALSARPSDLKTLQQFTTLMGQLDPSDVSKTKKAAEALASICASPDVEDTLAHSHVRKIPSEIKDELTADLVEMRRCMDAGCYRSTVIICGRLLEIALHRKYFEATGIDALEKTPGIGLGNLVAKLHEKGVDLDPAINQQIHLVNQVRIFSVHKKQQPFSPSKEQTQAIILYTTDILNKLFV